MLHVTDDWILPVGKIECTVGPDFQVTWSEIWIVREDDWLGFIGSIAAAVLAQVISEDALKADNIPDKQVTLRQGTGQAVLPSAPAW